MYSVSWGNSFFKPWRMFIFKIGSVAHDHFNPSASSEGVSREAREASYKPVLS